ncbi:glycine betaine ABC transporter substrate-binding protein [Kocuria sabuli]|uniref:glycine betaine ABC transporter substrate-binding protein n=1 Tax=Kocuria sabuli TaxID=3071448 RepID=UPI0034D4BF32
MFSTTPSIADNGLAVLEDPGNDFIAQQVVPLTTEGRLPQAAVDARNEHSGEISTEDLAEFDRRVSGEEPVNAADAAEEWRSANGC